MWLVDYIRKNCVKPWVSVLSHSLLSYITKDTFSMGTDGKSNSFILGAIPALYHKTFEHTSTKGKIFISEGSIDSFLNSPVLATTSIPGYLYSFLPWRVCLYFIFWSQLLLPTLFKVEANKPNISLFFIFFLPENNLILIYQYIKINIININQLYKNQYCSPAWNIFSLLFPKHPKEKQHCKIFFKIICQE